MTSEFSKNVSNSYKCLRYIYELPYRERKELCNILDMNDKWKELGGMYMQFDCTTLDQFSKAVYRRSSPTEELLVLWGNQNHTFVELFALLFEMRHFQAMKILKPFVDSKYHHLIFEGEDEVSQLKFLRNALNDKQSFAQESWNQQNENMNKTLDVDRKNKQNQKNDKDIKDVQNNKVVEKTAEKKLSDLSLGGGFETCIPHISYKELEVATNFWDKTNILGRGGFGMVFKGIWKNTAVAIKRLEPQKGNEVEYNVLEVQSSRELKYLNSCRHDNILPLYGYSIVGDKYCLIYQYMQNGSLEDKLQCRNGTKPLTWMLRCKIATGTARGLQFLHGMEKPLVHGDIKSANILLDPYFEPKIGDFGLAREGPVAQYTHIKVSRVHGTRPYLPDEFLRGKKFSTKVDAYSFGVVLFEIATGLRAYNSERAEKFLKEYVDGYDEEKIQDLMDVKAGNEDAHVFGILIKLGKNCIRNRPKDRPEVVDVLKQLDGIMADREMINQALHYVRQNSSAIPSNPLQLQMLYDQHPGRKQSLVPPSSSYHPQQWLFETPIVSNQPFSNRRSPSPTNPAMTNPSGPSQPFVGLKLVPEEISNKIIITENIREPDVNIPNIDANIPAYQNPPDIRLFPPNAVDAVRPVCNEISIANDIISSGSSFSEVISRDDLSVEKQISPEILPEMKSSEKNVDDVMPNITLLQK